MKTLVLIILISSVAFAAPSSEKISPFILGGVNAFPGEFPFIVSLQWVLSAVSEHRCGGAIIGSHWVISAARCFTNSPGLGQVEVLAGKHNLALTESSEVRIMISEAIVHPNYVPGPLVGPDDLVLLRTAAPFEWSEHIRAVRLPLPGSIPTTALTLSGWGSSDILRKSILPAISNQACIDAINSLGLIGNLINHTNFCTGPLTGEISACPLDRGGPLVYGHEPNEILEGIVSGGVTPCGVIGAPSGVFNHMSHYYDWIRLHVEIEH